MYAREQLCKNDYASESKADKNPPARPSPTLLPIRTQLFPQKAPCRELEKISAESTKNAPLALNL